MKRWAERYRCGESVQESSFRPHASPNASLRNVVKRIVSLRMRKRIGPLQLAVLCDVVSSTLYQVLKRCRLNRLSYTDRATGEVVCRCEHDQAGGLLVHVDVTKFASIPDGGRWRYVGKLQGNYNRAATENTPRNRHRDPLMRYCFVHTVIDDHSRVAYAQVHDDEKATTAVGVLRRATTWFAPRNVEIKQVISDNGACYRLKLWQYPCTEQGSTPERTRPYRGQTNGKIERFHPTLTDGWVYARCYLSEAERQDALDRWIHNYNHHQPHTSIKDRTPAQRAQNLPDQYT